MVHPSAECSWQRTEAVLACNVLNRMRDLGRPASRIVKFRIRVAEWPMTSQPPSYRGYRSPSEIISRALSFRDVEDLLAHRGVSVTYEAIRK